MAQLRDEDASDLTVELLRRLTEVVAGARMVVDSTLREFDLTTSLAAVLWSLDPHGPKLTMREVADRIGCDPSTVSIAADKLADSGLIVREPHPDDGRKRILALTPHGHELWRALSRRLHETSVLAALTPDEQRALLALLDKARS